MNILCLVPRSPTVCVCVRAGGSPACPCSDPHWGEALPMSHLWNTFPSPADAEEPHAHSHRGETIQRKYTLTHTQSHT